MKKYLVYSLLVIFVAFFGCEDKKSGSLKYLYELEVEAINNDNSLDQADFLNYVFENNSQCYRNASEFKNWKVRVFATPAVKVRVYEIKGGIMSAEKILKDASTDSIGKFYSGLTPDQILYISKNYENILKPHFRAIYFLNIDKISADAGTGVKLEKIDTIIRVEQFNSRPEDVYFGGDLELFVFGSRPTK